MGRRPMDPEEREIRKRLGDIKRRQQRATRPETIRRLEKEHNVATAQLKAVLERLRKIDG